MWEKKERQKEAETGDSKLKYFLGSWRIHSCSSFPGSDYVCLTIFAFFLKPPCYDSAACKERILIILKRKQKCLLSSINSNNSGIKLYVDCQSQSQLLKPVSHFWRVQSRGSMESATPAPGHFGGSIPTLRFPPEAGDCWPRGRNHRITHTLPSSFIADHECTTPQNTRAWRGLGNLLIQPPLLIGKKMEVLRDEEASTMLHDKLVAKPGPEPSYIRLLPVSCQLKWASVLGRSQGKKNSAVGKGW